MASFRLRLIEYNLFNRPQVFKKDEQIGLKILIYFKLFYVRKIFFTYIFRMFRFYTELELATVEDSREPAGLLYQELLNRWAHVARLTGGHAN